MPNVQYGIDGESVGVPDRRTYMAPGIFCIEGDWDGDLNQSSSVKPGLELLSQGRTRPVPFIHRTVCTLEEFEFYLGRWRLARMDGKRETPPLLYLALHGDPGVVHIGGRTLRLEEIADLLGTGLTDRGIHFGCCGTLDVDARIVRSFLRNTGINFAAGFCKGVGWLKSTVFDVLLFDAIFEGVLDQRGVGRIENTVRKEAGELARELGFRMITREP